jgi:hypothetical protein
LFIIIAGGNTQKKTMEAAMVLGDSLVAVIWFIASPNKNHRLALTL